MPVTTKRQRPAKSPVPTKKTEIPGRELPHTHQLIIDAVTEMLHSGGRTEDVNSLLEAAMSHTRRRLWGSGDTVSDTDRDKWTADFIRKSFDEWKSDLVSFWRNNRRSERPGVDAKTISDRLRFRARDRVRDLVEDFLEGASYEEQSFLIEVLEYRESNSLAALQGGGDEIYIATACAAHTDADDAGYCEYFRVPHELSERVQNYIDALRAVNDKAVA